MLCRVSALCSFSRFAPFSAPHATSCSRIPCAYSSRKISEAVEPMPIAPHILVRPCRRSARLEYPRACSRCRARRFLRRRSHGSRHSRAGDCKCRAGSIAADPGCSDRGAVLAGPAPRIRPGSRARIARSAFFASIAHTRALVGWNSGSGDGVACRTSMRQSGAKPRAMACAVATVRSSTSARMKTERGAGHSPAGTNSACAACTR